jgi:HTH-type transcriptional regulator/antitoxin HigA
LQKKGWGQSDLAQVLGRPASRVNELIQGKMAVSPELAAALAAALGGTAEDWLQRETAYRLSLSESDIDAIRARALLFELAPMKDLQKRGWIRSTDDPSIIEADLLHLFELQSISDEPQLVAVMRKTDRKRPVSGRLAASVTIGAFSTSEEARTDADDSSPQPGP